MQRPLDGRTGVIIKLHPRRVLMENFYLFIYCLHVQVPLPQPPDQEQDEVINRYH